MREAHGGLGLAGPPAKYKTQLEGHSGPGQGFHCNGSHWDTGISIGNGWARRRVGGRQWLRSLVASIRAAAAAAGTGLERFVSTGQDCVSTPFGFLRNVIGSQLL